MIGSLVSGTFVVSGIIVSGIFGTGVSPSKAPLASAVNSWRPNPKGVKKLKKNSILSRMATIDNSQILLIINHAYKYYISLVNQVRMSRNIIRN